jgi:hypothetical protein
MNMPSASNNLVHQMICDYAVSSIEDFLDELKSEDFLIFNQFYREQDRSTGKTFWTEKGQMILNTSFIGKVQVFFERD